MIIIICIGYQGIGKTSLCHNKNISFKFIDLESSCFRNDEGIRPNDWYIYYTNVAIDLSKQHNIVFVSSHKEVRDRLKDCSENVVCIFPSLKLKDQWIAKLETRYKDTGLDKDYRALQNAIHSYDENIKDLMECGIPSIEIEDMNYELKNLVINHEINIMRNQLLN